MSLPRDASKRLKRSPRRGGRHRGNGWGTRDLGHHPL